MKNLKRIAAILGLSLLIVAALSALPAETRTQPARAAFDHSNCQYPTRTTNPPDGCDNSDPANPYCAVKGLPEDCQEPQPVQQPAPTPAVTPAPAKAECGGK